MLTEDQIRTALRDCYDPAIPCNIVDLGLVQAIVVQPDPQAPGAGIPGVPEKHCVSLAITPTASDEGAEAQLTAQITNRLAGMEAVSAISVTVQHVPAWTPQSITPEGRRILGLDGNPTLVQIH